MLRDPNLIPLSQQHQHALALCVRVERALQAGRVDLNSLQQEIDQHFAREIQFHFAGEENVLFPAARQVPGLGNLVGELLAEHQSLRDFFGRAADRKMCKSELAEFAKLLSVHIRKEERQLFETMQKAMPADRLKNLGDQLKRYLQGTTCALTRPPERDGKEGG
jgi:hemerythrin-like domain-containing protein